MKYMNFKTVTLVLSVFALIALSGCEEEGIPSDEQLVGTRTVGQPPIAQAGADRTIEKGDSVTLNGKDSYDPDGEIVSYVWSLGSLTKTGMIIDIDNPPVGTATVTLTVEDNDGNTNSDTVVITVVDNPTNLPPEAKATADKEIYYCYANPEENIMLDASGSSDPENASLSFVWVGKFVQEDEYTIDIVNSTSAKATTQVDDDLCNKCAEDGYVNDNGDCKLIFNVDVSDGVNPSQNAQVIVNINLAQT